MRRRAGARIPGARRADHGRRFPSPRMQRPDRVRRAVVRRSRGALVCRRAGLRPRSARVRVGGLATRAETRVGGLSPGPGTGVPSYSGLGLVSARPRLNWGSSRVGLVSPEPRLDWSSSRLELVSTRARLKWASSHLSPVSTGPRLHQASSPTASAQELLRSAVASRAARCTARTPSSSAPNSSSRTMFAASDGDRSGSGCTSQNRPST